MSITVEETRKALAQMEREILAKVQSFEKRTGMEIASLTVQRTYVMGSKSGVSRIGAETRLGREF